MKADFAETSTIDVPGPESRAGWAFADWALVCLPGLIWGSSFLLIAQGLTAVAPDGVTFLRFVFGFTALSFLPAARRPIAPGDRRPVVWLGVLWLAFPMSMFPRAELSVSSALTGMLNGAVPLIATAVAALRERRAPSPPVMAGLAIGFCGCALMAIPELAAGYGSAAGIAMISAAVLSYGVAINLARPLQQRNGALPVVWRALGVALILTAPLGLPAVLAARWNPTAVLALLALGLLGTAGANVVMAMAAGKLGAARASTATFLIPVVALLLGVSVRREVVTFLAVGGGACCLAGAWIMRCQSLLLSRWMEVRK